MCLEVLLPPPPYLSSPQVALDNKWYREPPNKWYKPLNSFHRVQVALGNKWYREPPNKLYKLLKVYPQVHPLNKLPL
jgi:hypothetical protein